MAWNEFEVPEARAGDIIAFAGIEKLEISDTICHPDLVEIMPPLMVDEPTVTMTFQVNNSPFCRTGRQVCHDPPDT